MPVNVWVTDVTFSDGTTINFEPDEIIVLVGPNNSGKSAALRGIRQRVQAGGKGDLVILEAHLGRAGTDEEFMEWLESNTIRHPGRGQEGTYYLMDVGIGGRDALTEWHRTDHLNNLAYFMVLLVTADARLRATDPPPAIRLTAEHLTHPIHHLQRDDRVEARLSKLFRSAFGVDLIVHRNAGANVPLYTGKRPEPDLAHGEDRASLSYTEKIEALVPLTSQGDGMRSFAGVLLSIAVGAYPILLIDEPEAFLHPPQARQLGRFLVDQRPVGRQVFVATHSSDVLRGILHAGKKVQVIRLRREGDINHVTQLTQEKLQALWSDPLLRYSNTFDGLFHEAVVVTEGDSDCRFYSAMLDAVTPQGEPHPDVMFTHGGGKGRIPMVLQALRAVAVPVFAVVDFDALNDESVLRSIVEAGGGEWEPLQADWSLVKGAIDGKKPELNTKEVVTEISAILGKAAGTVFPQATGDAIREVLRRSSPWSIAKTTGKAYVPHGGPAAALDRLIAGLRQAGIFVVERGELEAFAPTVGGHGPAWVNKALARDLRNDPELGEARAFVSSLAQGIDAGIAKLGAQ